MTTIIYMMRSASSLSSWACVFSPITSKAITISRPSWPGQNLHRALVQFRLTAGIEASEQALKSLIAGLAAR